MSAASPQFQDYNSLVETVERYLARDDLTMDVKGFVWLAECDLQREVDFRLTDSIVSGSTISGEEYITLPDDYAQGYRLRWTSNDNLPTLEITSLDVTDQTQKIAGSNTSVLRQGTVWGDRLYIGPTPGLESFDLYYRSGVSHLGPNMRTNRLLQLYPDALLWGSLAASAPFLVNDERLATWLPLYQHAKDETKIAEQRARFPGPLRMRNDMRIF